MCFRINKILWVHQNENVFILMKFSSLAALEVVKMTNSSTASDENFVKMTFSFQCITGSGARDRGILAAILNDMDKKVIWNHRLVKKIPKHHYRKHAYHCSQPCAYLLWPITIGSWGICSHSDNKIGLLFICDTWKIHGTGTWKIQIFILCLVNFGIWYSFCYVELPCATSNLFILNWS